MKLLVMSLAVFGLIGFAQVSHAEETIAEKATVAGNATKRAIKKGVNKVEEELCGKLTGDSKVTCLAKAAKNRATETKDVVVDKASEVKNAVDMDKK